MMEILREKVEADTTIKTISEYLAELLLREEYLEENPDTKTKNLLVILMEE